MLFTRCFCLSGSLVGGGTMGLGLVHVSFLAGPFNDWSGRLDFGSQDFSLPPAQPLVTFGMGAVPQQAVF